MTPPHHPPVSTTPNHLSLPFTPYAHRPSPCVPSHLHPKHPATQFNPRHTLPISFTFDLSPLSSLPSPLLCHPATAPSTTTSTFQRFRHKRAHARHKGAQWPATNDRFKYLPLYSLAPVATYQDAQH
nr:hypothetical protein L203_06582 [Cryptococcus depauperatus CBS 7841]